MHTETVMTPSLPTRSIALAIKSPISFSPLAEMVPTYDATYDKLTCTPCA